MPERLAVDSDDARGAITSEHREDLPDPLSHDLGVTAAEESGRDGLFAIEEEERLRIAALEMLLHSVGLICMEECEPRLPGYRVPQQRPQLVVADEVDELERVGEGVAVSGGEKNERFRGRTGAQRA